MRRPVLPYRKPHIQRYRGEWICRDFYLQRHCAGKSDTAKGAYEGMMRAMRRAERQFDEESRHRILYGGLSLEAIPQG